VAITNRTEGSEVKTRDLSNEVTNVKAHVNKETETVRREITRVRQEMSDERAEWRNEAGEKFSSLHSGIQKLEQETRRRAIQVEGRLREFGHHVREVREARKSTSPEQNVSVELQQ
jgi:phage host-nuclease inhibitor protein Gam